VFNKVVDIAHEGETSWIIEDLFDHDKRFTLEDDISEKTSERMGSALNAFDDHEAQVSAVSYY
jgi:hypothetical protein